ncbi:MAG: YihA family ribosome biogenesis GTP-binding protein [Clostridiaceae bacterium]|jgi:GTP-binding protein|nr:ribosome biogenesis GTP-binding protein YihA/YsxC [Oscillospiraceae bacterium]NLO62132.1 YihA family ribosome biogenesis GTP-binding protein [Clostridiaceae bacterium]
MMIQFRNTRFVMATAELSQAPIPDRPEIVLSGKSNVGKSSLINALADNKKLARISGEPGKTRLVIYFDVDNRFYLVDLPGYGYAKAPHSVQKQYGDLVERYFAVGRPISLILHLVDIRHKPSQNDLMMIDYMNTKGLPYFLIYTKADKLSAAEIRRKTDEYLEDIPNASTIKIFSVSSEKKKGLEDVRTAIDEFLYPMSVEG